MSLALGLPPYILETLNWHLVMLAASTAGHMNHTNATVIAAIAIKALKKSPE